MNAKTKDTQLKRALESVSRLKSQVTELQQANAQVILSGLLLLLSSWTIFLLFSLQSLSILLSATEQGWGVNYLNASELIDFIKINDRILRWIYDDQSYNDVDT